MPNSRPLQVVAVQARLFHLLWNLQGEAGHAGGGDDVGLLMPEPEERPRPKKSKGLGLRVRFRWLVMGPVASMPEPVSGWHLHLSVVGWWYATCCFSLKALGSSVSSSSGRFRVQWLTSFSNLGLDHLSLDQKLGRLVPAKALREKAKPLAVPRCHHVSSQRTWAQTPFPKGK